MPRDSASRTTRSSAGTRRDAPRLGSGFVRVPTRSKGTARGAIPRWSDGLSRAARRDWAAGGGTRVRCAADSDCYVAPRLGASHFG